MLRVRVIPCLLLKGDALVKTTRFRSPSYIGDPVNTVRIFNELEVDELAFLDIRASREGRGPDFDLLREITNECFMPLSYGGGVGDLETAERLFAMGFEKVVVNTAAVRDPDLVTRLARRFGSQAVVVSIDVRSTLFRHYRVYSLAGTRKTPHEPQAWALEMERRGAGEILLTSMDREGTWSGFDVELTAAVTAVVDVPVIAHGGCGSLGDLTDAVVRGGASAVAVGSMVVYQGRGKGVLVNFPDRRRLNEAVAGGAST